MYNVLLSTARVQVDHLNGEDGKAIQAQAGEEEEDGRHCASGNICEETAHPKYLQQLGQLVRTGRLSEVSTGITNAARTSPSTAVASVQNMRSLRCASEMWCMLSFQPPLPCELPTSTSTSPSSAPERRCRRPSTMGGKLFNHAPPPAPRQYNLRDTAFRGGAC